MAQIFQSDARTSANDVTLPNGVPTLVLSTIPLNPPFDGGCKGKVVVVILATVGADNTSIAAAVVRNIDSDDAGVADFSQTIATPGAGTYIIPLGGIDLVPDGRPVSYSVLVGVSGGSADGAANAGSYIEATLISG